MLSTILALAVAFGPTTVAAQTGCLDSFLHLGDVQAPPSASGSDAAHTVRRIDRVVAVDAPGKPTIGFVYRTADGNPFFGSRTTVTPEARPYVRRLFERDGLASAAQLEAVLQQQHGDAILWIPNAAHLLPRLDLATASCVATRHLA